MDTSITNTLRDTVFSISKGLLNFIKLDWTFGNEGVMVLGGLMGVYFNIRRYWKEFWLTLVGFGGSLIFLALSHLFNRHRPVLAVLVANILTGPGFPSGHAVVTVTLYSCSLTFYYPRYLPAFGKSVVIIIAVLIMLFIGFSRLSTGGHYLTDVNAGYTGISYMTIETYFAPRNKRKIENAKIGGKP